MKAKKNPLAVSVPKKARKAALPDPMLPLLPQSIGLEQLIDALPQIVWSAGLEGNIDYYNKRALDYGGVTSEEAVKLGGWQAVMHPDDIERCAVEWEKARDAGVMYEIEYRLLEKKSNTYHWHLGRAIPVRDDAGVIVRWFGTCTDIHEQKSAQERVRANLERLHSTIARLPFAAVVIDEQDRIVAINNPFCEFFALPQAAATLVGSNGWQWIKTCMNQVHEADAELSMLQSLTITRGTHCNQKLHLHDGRIFLRDYLPIIEQGIFWGYLLLYRDVTREHRTDAMKSEFMSLASHQLRTPLTTIRWIFNELEQQEAPATLEEKELLEEGKKSAKHMAEAINAMLQISAIEAGEIVPHHESIPLSDFLLDLMQMHHQDYEKKYQTVSCVCPAELTVTTDEKFLQELVGNLLGNAIKYTPEAGIIRLISRKTERGVEIMIQDTGMGIPQAQQEHVFRKKFFRAENAVKKETSGTGLGLYLVHLLTRLLGGQISFVSQEGAGTTFTLVLPA